MEFIKPDEVHQFDYDRYLKDEISDINNLLKNPWIKDPPRKINLGDLLTIQQALEIKHDLESLGWYIKYRTNFMGHYFLVWKDRPSFWQRLWL